MEPQVPDQETGEVDPRLAEFRLRVEGGVGDFLDFVAEFGDTPLPPDPSSMMDDPRSMEELLSDEQMVVRDVVYSALGLHGSGDIEVRRYETEAPPEARVPGKVRVTVSRTNREGIFIHEMVFPDGALRWAVGPDVDI